MLGIGAASHAWETFVINDLDNLSGTVSSGDRITLLSNNGYYACAESGGGGVVNVNRYSAGSWETFVIHF
jgi:hypothetical protein